MTDTQDQGDGGKAARREYLERRAAEVMDREFRFVKADYDEQERRDAVRDQSPVFVVDRFGAALGLVGKSMARSPDGVVLYETCVPLHTGGCKQVFFSSAGAQYDVRSGKVTHQEFTPAGNP